MAFRTIVLVFCSLLFGCSANILWDNNYNTKLTESNIFSPYISRGFEVYDDFQLQEDVTSLTVQMLVGSLSGSTPSVTWTLFNDNNGVLGNRIMSSTANVVSSEKTGKIFYGSYKEFTMCFVMSGITLSRQTTYWLKFSSNDDNNELFAELFSSGTKKLNTGYQLYSSGAPTNNIGDLNYRLSDDGTQCPIIQSTELTSAKMTTAQMTTAQMTTAQMTTAQMTSAEMTTAEMTTAEMTTAEMTTAKMTTAKMTTAAMTTGRITSQALTTGSYSQFLIRFTSNFVGEVVIQQPFSSSGITFMLNGKDRNIYPGRTLYITRTPYYSNPALIRCKSNARNVFAKATTIDGVSWYFPDTTFQFMTTKYYYYLEPLATGPVNCS